MVTGRNSYTRFEQVLELQRAAEDGGVARPVRQAAIDALAEIDTNGKVNGAYRRFKAVQTGCLESRQAASTIRNRTDDADATGHDAAEATPAVTSQRQERNRVRAFLLGLNRLSGWTADHDPVQIGPALSKEQWSALQTTAIATAEFVDRASRARQNQ
jgi:ParB family chromosome partitioning protein